jgi:hypothetical protein
MMTAILVSRGAVLVMLVENEGSEYDNDSENESESTKAITGNED